MEAAKCIGVLRMRRLFVDVLAGDCAKASMEDANTRRPEPLMDNRRAVTCRLNVSLSALKSR